MVLTWVNWALQGTPGDVWGHFWLSQQGVLLALPGWGPGMLPSVLQGLESPHPKNDPAPVSAVRMLGSPDLACLQLLSPRSNGSALAKLVGADWLLPPLDGAPCPVRRQPLGPCCRGHCGLQGLHTKDLAVQRIPLEHGAETHCESCGHGG